MKKRTKKKAYTAHIMEKLKLQFAEIHELNNRLRQKDSEVGELLRLIDAILIETTINYGKTVEENAAWEISMPIISVEKNLKYFTLKTSKDNEAENYLFRAERRSPEKEDKDGKAE